MALESVALLVAITSVLIITGIVFYKTIVTREWRDRVETEADSWRLGVFYYNPSDRRLLLPKRSGLGWTINFGRPAAVVIALLSLVAIVAFSMLL